jgi:hypothetical protein
MQGWSKRVNMGRFLVLAVVIASIATVFSEPASAQVGKGLSGAHYTLNIIGVSHDKTAVMDGSNRHTIFVPLQTGGAVPRDVKIYYVAGDRFEVLDGNATDGEATIMVPSEPLGDLSYDVYAWGLGKPDGNAVVTAECVFDNETLDACTDTLLMGGFTVTRSKGQPKRVDITNVFRATGCIDLGGTVGVCDTGDLGFKNVWVFNIPNLLEYFWNYDNNGLKLMHIRFYETTSGEFCDGPCQ